MAEGMFGGLVGEEAEARESEAAEAAHADALAAALAVQHAAADPVVAASAAAFLDAQTRMLGLQAAHLPEEVALRLAAMRATAREARVRRFGQIIRVAMQVLIALLVGGIVVAFVVAVADALKADGVVIEPFDTPATLAAQGLSGRVVAGGVLDTLTTIQDDTRSVAAKRNISDAWTGGIKVEIPETGLSVGEVGRLLKDRLGHETHIGGDLVREPDGRLTLTVRGDGVRPKAFTGPATDLAGLEAHAAEYIYGEASPYLYTAYLIQHRTPAEGVAFASEAFRRASAAQRPLLLQGWAISLARAGDRRGANDKLRLALRLQPDLWNSWGNLMANTARIEGEEATFRISLDFEREAAARGATPDDLGLAVRIGQALRQDWTGYLAAHEAIVRRYGNGGFGSGDLAISMADAAGYLHDWAAVERYLASADPLSPDTVLESKVEAGRRLLESGHPAAALVPLTAFYADIQTHIAHRNNYLDGPCVVGLAYALAGQPREAEAVFDATGRWVECYSYHADNLEIQAKRAEADVAYARAVALSPSLPFAYYHWGLALLARGDTAGALVKFAAASARGPRWADPLKGAGDALARQGKWHDALAKYTAAAPFAPNWEALREAIAAARKRSG